MQLNNRKQNLQKFVLIFQSTIEDDIVITSEGRDYSCQKNLNYQINALKNQAKTLKINIIRKHIELLESSNTLEKVFEQLLYSYQPCPKQKISSCSSEYYYDNSPFSEEGHGVESPIIGYSY